VSPRVSKTGNALSAHRYTGSFEQHAYLAAIGLSKKSDNTRYAYLADLRKWVSFAAEHRINLFSPLRKQVDLWVDTMKEGELQPNGKRKPVAPKTRARRISSLCSIYRELRRLDGDNQPGVVTFNPFSVDEGSAREGTPQAVEPTPLPTTSDVTKLLETCAAGKPLDIRDRAIIRVLWATGARRSSVLDMRIERITVDRAGYVTDVIVKGSKTVRVLITGRAREALDAWLTILETGGIDKGPVWRVRSSATLTGKGMWQMFIDRSARAGLREPITPHMMRVAFLTLNGATVEERQHGVGHANPATTQIYDRTAWRGRAAFEKMPEIEDAE
jgi:integrase/recombinase XerD